MGSYVHSDSFIVADDGWSIPSTFFQQTVKQLEVTQGVVLSQIYRVND